MFQRDTNVTCIANMLIPTAKHAALKHEGGKSLGETIAFTYRYGRSQQDHSESKIVLPRRAF